MSVVVYMTIIYIYTITVSETKLEPWLLRLSASKSIRSSVSIQNVIQNILKICKKNITDFELLFLYLFSISSMNRSDCTNRTDCMSSPSR